MITQRTRPAAAAAGIPFLTHQRHLATSESVERTLSHQDPFNPTEEHQQLRNMVSK